MKKGMIAGMILLLLTACGPQLEQGKVVNKKYDDPDTWVTTSCVMYGKYGCQAYSTQTHHHD